MKKIYLLAATAITAFSLASCGINDVENYGEIASGNFPASEADADAALAGIYQNLNAVNANPQESFLYYAQLASDDDLGGGGVNDKLMQAEDLLCSYNANMTNDFYVQRYEGISRANTLIQSLQGSSVLSDEKKAQTLGEAKFLRAFYYYELSSMYGNVPLRVEPGGQDIKQGDILDVWKQILMDLRDASRDMPAKRRSDGHVDKYTAEAMLGRAWLFYSGFFCNGTTIADETSTTYNPLTSCDLPDGTTLTKQDVIGYIDDCVDNSGYSLVSDFRNLWAYTNRCTAPDYPYTNEPVMGKAHDGVTDSIVGYKAKPGIKWVEDDLNKGVDNNPESMFAIKFNKFASWNTTIGYANGYALHFGVRGGQDYAKTFPFGQGWGAGPVAPNLVNDWKATEPNDMRLKATVADVNDKDEMPDYTRGGWADFVQETDYYAKKWAPITAKNADVKGGYSCTFENVMYPGNWDVSGVENMQLGSIHDLVLIRFADVLLMQSELKEDVAGINHVRERAGLPPIGSYSLTALQNERRWELACEGIRWNDLRRWHIAAAALQKQNGQKIYYCGQEDTNTPHNGGYAARYNATAGFQKMPEDQVSIGTVVQNEGWTTAESEYQGWK